MSFITFLIGFIIALFIPSPIDSWMRNMIKLAYDKIINIIDFFKK